MFPVFSANNCVQGYVHHNELLDVVFRIIKSVIILVEQRDSSSCHLGELFTLVSYANEFLEEKKNINLKKFFDQI